MYSNRKLSVFAVHQINETKNNPHLKVCASRGQFAHHADSRSSSQATTARELTTAPDRLCEGVGCGTWVCQTGKKEKNTRGVYANSKLRGSRTKRPKNREDTQLARESLYILGSTMVTPTIKNRRLKIF